VVRVVVVLLHVEVWKSCEEVADLLANRFVSFQSSSTSIDEKLK
jgi:hypothetical protein